MKRTLLILAPVLALAACDDGSQKSETPRVAPEEARMVGDSEPSEPPAEAAPQPEIEGGDDRMSWKFSTAAGPKLTYGEPATDNVRLMMRCAGADRVILSFLQSAAPDNASRMTVRSHGASQTIATNIEATQLEGVSVSAELSASAAPLEQFREGNPLRVEWASEMLTVPPAGAEAERFLGAC